MYQTSPSYKKGVILFILLNFIFTCSAQLAVPVSKTSAISTTQSRETNATTTSKDPKSTKKTLVYLEHSEALLFDQERLPGIQLLQGDVCFRHDNAYLYCDVVAAYFDNQETLNGYYNIYYQILTKYGIPYLFKTDKRTVFEYNKKGTTSDEDNTFTQFAYACSQLGTSIETSSVPEFKPRIERLFESFQLRLIPELRLANITTIEEANKFLPIFLEKYNSKLALCIDNTKSVFEKQPSKEKINLTLAVLSHKIIDT